MKNIFKTLIGFAAATLLAASCDVSNIGTTYTPSSDPNVSFYQTNAEDLEVSPNNATYDVVLVRQNADAAITVSLTSTLPSSVSVPSSVSFAAGEYSANLPIDITALEIGEICKGTISLANEADYNSKFSISSITVNIMKAYIWTSLGKGWFFDNLALMTETTLGLAEVEVLKAEGFDVYRIMNPYSDAAISAAGWEPGGERSSFIQFRVLENGTNLAWDGWWKPGILYDGDGTDIKAYYPSALADKYAADNAKSVKDGNYFLFYPYWYIDGLGGFGTSRAVILAMPGVTKAEFEAYLYE